MPPTPTSTFPAPAPARRRAARRSPNRVLRRPAGNQSGPLLWLFDLDNTLHDASHAIFPAINAQMTAYVAQVLGCDEATASRVRVGYWHRYGATLLGMIRHHGVDPAEFLHAAHDFPHLADMVRIRRGLAASLRRLPGRKILLTNAPQEYARAVLRVAGIEQYFERVVAIEQMWVHGELRPKPDRRMLRYWLARLGARPSRVMLVEDTVSHLKRYAGLGIRTAWVTGYLRTLTPSRPHDVPAGAARDAITEAVLQAGRTLPARGAPDGAAASGPPPAADAGPAIAPAERDAQAQQHAVTLVAAESQTPVRPPLPRARPRQRPGYVNIKVQSAHQLHRRMRGIGS